MRRRKIEAIQARVLPGDALDIVGDEEAGQFVGGYIKQARIFGFAAMGGSDSAKSGPFRSWRRVP